MLNIFTLATGSSGNCYIVQYEPNKCFILEAGIPVKIVKQFLYEKKLTPTFLLISHEHGDHLNFVNNYTKEFLIKAFIHKKITETKHKTSLYNICYIKENQILKLTNQGIWIKTFLLMHDVPNLGFQIEFLKTYESIIYLTDLGTTKNLPTKFVSMLTNETLKPTFFMIESNYSDNTMTLMDLQDEEVKKKNLRVKSDFGHLSNLDCLDYLLHFDLIDTEVILIHASSDNINETTDYLCFDSLIAKKITIAKPCFAYKTFEKQSF